MARPPRLVGVAEIEVAQRAADGDLADRGQVAQRIGLLLQLVERTGDGRVFELGAGPAIVGSSPRTATIVLPQEGGVAPEHARIWLRDGQYLLHHTSGAHRRTLVGGHPADWVVLEPGDDVQFGSLRFVFEDDGPAGADATGG